jgi:hypothetical protein
MMNWPLIADSLSHGSLVIEKKIIDEKVTWVSRIVLSFE